MAQVTLVINPQAQNYLSSFSETMTLSENVSDLFDINNELNNSYFYFDRYHATASKATMGYADGSTRSYYGKITPTYIGNDYETGTAVANSTVLNIPAGIRESLKGELFYSYTADQDSLSFSYIGGTISEYKIELARNLSDPTFGKITLGLRGNVAMDSNGGLSGSLSQLFTTAQKLEKSSLTAGDFTIGGTTLAPTLSGTIEHLRYEYYDKSLVDVVDARPTDGSSTWSLDTLRDESYWSGDDVFNVTLSNKATQTLRIHSGNGNDHLTLKGGLGLLAVNAGAGDDTIRLLDRYPVIQGGNGQDTVETAFSHSLESLSDIENLTLYGNKKADAIGNALDNRLLGNRSANLLDGKAGADIMIGDGGNDTYIVDDAADQVIEALNQGIETVKASLSWTLGDHLERLELLGGGNFSATGNALANKISGNSGSNTLDGAAGLDTLAGGAGADTYIIDLLQKGQGNKAKLMLEDKVIETANNGNDTLQLRGEFKLANVSTLQLANHLENLDASQTGLTRLNLVGNNGDNLLIGNAADNILIGGAGADTLMGGEGNDTFRFNSLKELGLGARQDVILGFTAGEDLLDFSRLKGYSFIGNEAFSGSKQLRYEIDGEDLTLYGNSGGNLLPEFSVQLVGITTLNADSLLT